MPLTWQFAAAAEPAALRDELCCTGLAMAAVVATVVRSRKRRSPRFPRESDDRLHIYMKYY